MSNGAEGGKKIEGGVQGAEEAGLREELRTRGREYVVGRLSMVPREGPAWANGGKEVPSRTRKPRRGAVGTHGNGEVFLGQAEVTGLWDVIRINASGEQHLSLFLCVCV